MVTWCWVSSGAFRLVRGMAHSTRSPLFDGVGGGGGSEGEEGRGGGSEVLHFGNEWGFVRDFSGWDG